MSIATSITPAEVREIRRRLGLTQRELAEQMGVTVDAVVNWENARSGLNGSSETLLRRMATDAGRKSRR